MVLLSDSIADELTKNENLPRPIIGKWIAFETN